MPGVLVFDSFYKVRAIPAETSLPQHPRDFLPRKRDHQTLVHRESDPADQPGVTDKLEQVIILGRALCGCRPGDLQKENQRDQRQIQLPPLKTGQSLQKSRLFDNVDPRFWPIWRASAGPGRRKNGGRMGKREGKRKRRKSSEA